MPMSRLIYYSENQLDPRSGSVVRQLRDILSAAAQNNKAKDITGALIFDDQWFLQILEGEREKIWRLFNRIGDDDRHSGVVLAELVEIDRRTFGNWWMGLATRSEDTEAAFAPFLLNGLFDPRCLTAAQMHGLAIELAKRGLHRELRPTEAAGAAIA